MDRAKPFMTIREACNYSGLSQRFLRDGCKSGIIPHIMSGNTYMINVAMLMETLDSMSKDSLIRSGGRSDPEVKTDGDI